MNLFDTFTNISSEPKTLRFRLIPMGQTQKYIEEKGFIEQDYIRNEQRAVAIKCMDDFYRDMIEKSLGNFRTEWNDLFNIMHECRIRPEESKQKKLKQIQEKMAKIVFNTLKGSERFGDCFSAKLMTELLPDYITRHTEYTDQEKTTYTKTFLLFNRFTGYFLDYLKARKNIFSKELKSGSIVYRVVVENASLFLDNMKTFEYIQKDETATTILEELQERETDALDGWKLKQVFHIDFYNFVLTQKGIDFYNFVCGKLNQIMNLYCQKNKLNKNHYKMRFLYKQQLSIHESRFVIPEKLDCDMEVYAAVNGFLRQMREVDVIQKLKLLLTETEGYDWKCIYIPSDRYTDFSNILYKSWSVLPNALRSYHASKIKPTAKNREEKIEKEVKADQYRSLAEIQMIMENYAEYKTEPSAREYLLSGITLAEEVDLKDVVYDSSISLLESEEKATELKNKLDPFLNMLRWLKGFVVKKELTFDVEFYGGLQELLEWMDSVILLYNRVRSYVTQKPYKQEKIKLNFDTPTLADGWAKSKEYSNNCVLFMRNGNYYLGVFNPKNKPEKEILQGKEIAGSENDFKKMEYYLIPEANKMLPKVLLVSESAMETYHPDQELLKNYRAECHKKSSDTFDLKFCHELIDYFKKCIAKHPEWSKFGFEFSETSSYTDISQFYREVELQGYRMNFVYVSEEDIDRLVEEGKLYFFQIWNKDFSEGSKGHENLHTMYFKSLFAEENLKDVVMKLNGCAELFFRKASIQKPYVHKKGEYLVNKTIEETDTETGKIIRRSIPGANYEELVDYVNGKKQKEDLSAATRDKYLPKCKYRKAHMDIVKDRRYTADQYMFHCPITINFKAAGTTNLNDKVLKYLAEADKKDLHIIGIDRGERNLLYVSVINAEDGRIIQQKSYNIVKQFDYHEKLTKMEQARQDARKNWKEIGKIKEVKEGYLSLVIHEITELVLKYKAIIVMEDLNYGFKRGRMCVEKSVYQKFEEMLINKLTYLVDKTKASREPGGVLNGYQLAYIPSSMKEIGRQCGIIFYVPAGYTSKIDPVTGFVDVFNYKSYTTNEKKVEFIETFDSIFYEKETDQFGLSFDYAKFTVFQQDTLKQKKWTAYTNGMRIINKKIDGYWNSIAVDLTKEFKMVVSGWNYKDGHNLLEDFVKLESKQKVEVAKQLFDLIRYTMQMRNSKINESFDQLISPIRGQDNVNFDSENKEQNLPFDADANGAYHIARKGLYIIEQIQAQWDPSKKFDRKVLKIGNAEWFAYVQQ